MYRLILELTNEEAATLLTHANETRKMMATKMVRAEGQVEDAVIRTYNLMGRLIAPALGLAVHVHRVAKGAK